MEDNVKIKIIGTQSDMTDNESTTFLTTGKWYKKNGKDYILYTDHELIDSAVTKTRVTYDGKCLSVIRNGGTNTHLLFEPKTSHIMPYETPMGFLEMVSTTKEIHFTSTECLFDIKVVYNLEINQMDMGTSIFHLTAEKF